MQSRLKSVCKRVVIAVPLAILICPLLLPSNVDALPQVGAIVSVQAVDTGMIRLAGQSRYDTAVQIAKDGWSQSDYAILAYGENYPDALSSSPLSYKYDAPILLTYSNNLTDVTKQALQELKVKHVFIVGGTGVISSTVENQVKAIVPDVERLAGQTRYDTSVEIAKKLGSDVNGVFIATGAGYADALSAGSIAGKLGMPILLVDKDNVPDSVQSYLSSHNIQKSYVIGGQSVLSDSVLQQVPNPTRLSGNDRYETNTKVLNQFDSALGQGTICMSTGEGFADALTGAAYAAKKGAHLVLTPPSSHPATQDYIKGKLNGLNNVIVFGGMGAVPSSVINPYFAGNPKFQSTPSAGFDTPSTVNTGTVDTGSGQTATGHTVYAKPITQYGQTLSKTPSSGYATINVLYGYHTYGSNNQKEYDAVMGEVNKAKANAESTIDQNRVWQAVQNYLNGVPTSSDKNYAGWMTNLTIKTLSKSQVKTIATAIRAEGIILNAQDYSGEYHSGDGESSYALLFNGKGDCNAQAYTDQAIWDSYGFNTKIVYSSNHAWCIVQVGDTWFTVEGVFAVDGHNFIGTLIGETTSGNL